MVEGYNTININFGNPKVIGDSGRCLIRNATKLTLDFTDNVEHHGSVFAMFFHSSCDYITYTAHTPSLLLIFYIN